MRQRLILVGGLLTAVKASPPQWPEEHHIHGNEKGWPHSTEVYIPEEPAATWPAWPHHSNSEHGPPFTYASPPYSTVYPNPTTTVSSSTSSSSSASTTTEDACASVRDLQASQATQAGPANAYATVPAALAYECINSVPFNSTAAVALLDSIRPYVNWQTTIQWLKNPPAEYAQKIQPPYDFWAKFDQVYANAKSGSYYANEYDFGFDLYRTFQVTHDGHFVVYPDSVTTIFSFGRTTPLVSVSVDGTSIPEVYVYQDLMETIVGNASFTPSPLTMIDGQNSTEYLLNWSMYGSLQDPDALWNNMFYLLQQVSLGSSGTGAGTFAGGGRGRWIYPGPTTTLTFANGSTVTNENFARVLADFTNITSGADIYAYYFTPPADEVMSAEELATSTSTTATSTPTSTTAPTSTSSSTTIAAPGYPTPVVREMSNLNSGYFLDGEDYDDVAVLSMASFVGTEADEIPFQAVNTYFLQRAVAANKTKLIIDVSANGGGTILQGYDIFKQLFPSILPYGATRFRAHEALDYIGQESSFYSGLVPRSLDLNDTAINIVSSVFNYRTDDDVDYKPFTSWAEKYGPQTFGPEPDNYTEIIRWNMSDVLTPINSGGIYISGYLNRTNITMQPFAAENIVVVTDGYCASTCTIFSELMRQQAGVKFINLGGRPNKAITQAIGGVKGTNDFGYADILYYAIVPFTTMYLHSAAFYNSTALGAYNNLVLFRTLVANINVRDGFRIGDVGNDSVPLQFRYEAADCRLYYTPEMAVDQAAAWKTVADAAWGSTGSARCIGGDDLQKRADGKSGVQQKKHRVRADVDLDEHMRVLENVGVGGRNAMPLGGEGFMVV